MRKFFNLHVNNKIHQVEKYELLLKFEKIKCYTLTFQSNKDYISFS
jgi:hypothetical protein